MEDLMFACSGLYRCKADISVCRREVQKVEVVQIVSLQLGWMGKERELVAGGGDL